ncbi:UPF0058 family protein [Methanimicrococcus hacksteinii]|uniref:UPF0058 family protein n=1 Tax=Methanimicrococcus hacksteinii TaxID=3028293 RepID=UPI00298F0D62|nr:UPF0058 family protein [Methanimicrococcus sp. At1]
MIIIQKQDLLRIHADLAKMKNSYEKIGYRKEFEDYDELCITPVHIHKSKDDHEKAIFLLSSELSIVAEEHAIYQIIKNKRRAGKPRIHSFAKNGIKDVFNDTPEKKPEKKSEEKNKNEKAEFEKAEFEKAEFEKAEFEEGLA